MPDMLVKLYELPRLDPIMQVMEERGIQFAWGCHQKSA